MREALIVLMEQGAALERYRSETSRWAELEEWDLAGMSYRSAMACADGCHNLISKLTHIARRP